MRTAVSIIYCEPGLRRVDVVIDDKPWYQEFLRTESGLVKYLRIGDNSLSIKIGPEPVSEPFP